MRRITSDLKLKGEVLRPDRNHSPNRLFLHCLDCQVFKILLQYPRKVEEGPGEPYERDPRDSKYLPQMNGTQRFQSEGRYR